MVILTAPKRYHSLTSKQEKKKQLIIEVAIVNRGNHMVNGFIVSEIRGHALIRDDQTIQAVTEFNGCTPLIST